MLVKMEPRIRRYLTNFIKYNEEKFKISNDIKHLNMANMLVYISTYRYYYTTLQECTMHFNFNEYILRKTIIERLKEIKDKTIIYQDILRILLDCIVNINLKNGTFTITETQQLPENDEIKTVICDSCNQTPCRCIKNKYIIFILTNARKYLE
jgi:hypothetical protein